MNMSELCDLHSHILPGIDDGSEDCQTSRRILLAERKDGVGNIIFTPHFYAGRESADEFLKRRERSYELIKPICGELEIEVKLGAEVAMRPELLHEDIEKLGLGDTGYLLLEWPFFNEAFPLWGDGVADAVLESGLRPIFAHIERYRYFFVTPNRLERYIKKGALCQMNCSAVLDSRTRQQALRLLRQGYAHIIATDTHGIERRKPRLKSAMCLIREKAGESLEERIRRYASEVFRGEDVKTEVPKRGFMGRISGR